MIKEQARAELSQAQPKHGLEIELVKRKAEMSSNWVWIKIIFGAKPSFCPRNQRLKTALKQYFNLL